jgi:hypothetical protein
MEMIIDLNHKLLSLYIFVKSNYSNFIIYSMLINSKKKLLKKFNMHNKILNLNIIIFYCQPSK